MTPIKCLRLHWVCWLALSFICPLVFAQAVHPNQPFTVKDDINITQFGDVWTGEGERPLWSPDHTHVAVRTTKGALEDGRIHDWVLVYDLATLQRALARPDINTTQTSKPEWEFDMDAPPNDASTPTIKEMQWFEDSRGLAILRWTEKRTRQLVVANLPSHRVEALTSPEVDVISFAVRDSSHFVFTRLSQDYLARQRSEISQAQRVGTGKSLMILQFPEEILGCCGPAEVWAATGGVPHRVAEQASGRSLILHSDGTRLLALSHDGRYLVTVRAYASIPAAWEILYPPPYAASAYRIKAGLQSVRTSIGTTFVGEYVLVDLQKGTVRSLTGAPEAKRAGWFEGGSASPAWSPHDRFVALPGTFIADRQARDRPCFAVVSIKSGEVECIAEMHRNLARGFETNYASVRHLDFGSRNEADVQEDVVDHATGNLLTRDFIQQHGIWERFETSAPAEALVVKIVASPKQPPLLAVADAHTGKTAILLNPNPQLAHMDLAVPSAYTWTDIDGTSWKGQLYLPPNYRRTGKLPLVIQNHGIEETRFIPSGEFPSAFIAQELASIGIAVLQVRDCPGRGTSVEGICNVHGYEAAIRKLSEEGVVDSQHVGLIGFSRTVYYVLEAITRSPDTFQAVSIYDGINFGYAEYLGAAGSESRYEDEEAAVIGDLPLGRGVDTWVVRSPVFNLSKVKCPVRIIAKAGMGISQMWEPYVLLRAQNKPIDFVILNTREHIITDPRVRYIAQQGNLDWFRFWLQGYQDPDPMKREQYLRWQSLRRGKSAAGAQN